MRRLCLILLVGLLCQSGWAETVAQLSTKIRTRSVAIDTRRFDTTTMLHLVNQAQDWIATKGYAIEAETTYVLSTTAIRYRLPGRFLAVGSAELNPNPTQPAGPENPPTILTYTPYGQPFLAPAGTGRPSAYQIWRPDLKLNRYPPTLTDTLRLQYFAVPAPLTADTSVIRLPDVWLPLLRDLVFDLCLARIMLAPPPTEEQITQRIQQTRIDLYGRPTDEK